MDIAVACGGQDTWYADVRMLADFRRARAHAVNIANGDDLSDAIRVN